MTEGTDNRAPLISVIVPVYKVEQYLPQCIESIVGQTYRNLEIILVDDGSPDRCGEICDAYAARDSRIKVIHKENGGLVSARNAGQRAVTGEWFTFLDSDDWLSPEMCVKLSDAITRHPRADLFFWKCMIELEGKSVVGKFEWREQKPEYVYRGEACRNLARHVLVYDSGISTAGGKLIRTEYARRKDIFHNLRLQQGIEGYDFCLRAFYQAQMCVYLNEYFYHYRYNENGISKSVDEKNTQYITDGFVVLKEDIQRLPDREVFEPILNQRICYVLIAMALNSYYHLGNRDSICTKGRKFGKVIDGNEIYRTALREADTSAMGLTRRITLWFIRHRWYFMLHGVSYMKSLMLKLGYYNY